MSADPRSVEKIVRLSNEHSKGEHKQHPIAGCMACVFGKK